MHLARLVPSSFTLATALLLAAQLPACGGSVTAAASPSGTNACALCDKSGEASLPADPEGTLAELDRAENDLTAALGPAKPSGALAGAAPDQVASEKKEAMTTASREPPPPRAAPASEAHPAPPAAPAPERASESESPAIEEQQVLRPPCERACRALSSMQRATDHLCGLAGDADARCDNARERVRNAEARVHAACPACQQQ